MFTTTALLILAALGTYFGYEMGKLTELNRRLDSEIARRQRERRRAQV